VINRFSEEQKKAIIEKFPNGEANNYLSNISEKLILKFIKLNTSQLVGLLG
jgi:hypothetical protein